MFEQSDLHGRATHARPRRRARALQRRHHRGRGQEGRAVRRGRPAGRDRRSTGGRTPHTLGKAIVRAVEAHATDTRLADDLTVLAIRRPIPVPVIPGRRDRSSADARTARTRTQNAAAARNRRVAHAALTCFRAPRPRRRCSEFRMSRSALRACRMHYPAAVASIGTGRGRNASALARDGCRVTTATTSADSDAKGVFDLARTGPRRLGGCRPNGSRGGEPCRRTPPGRADDRQPRRARAALSPTIDRGDLGEFTARWITPGLTRVTLKERERIADPVRRAAAGRRGAARVGRQRTHWHLAGRPRSRQRRGAAHRRAQDPRARSRACSGWRSTTRGSSRRTTSRIVAEDFEFVVPKGTCSSSRCRPA